MRLKYRNPLSCKMCNPYLIFASESMANMCKRSVMEPTPHTQHRPICVNGHPVIVPQSIDDLKVKSISVTAANHVEVIKADLPDVVVHSVYKPPIEQFVLPPLGHRSQPQSVIGDSNSLTLIHDTKQQKSFNSARWKKCYNPDLIFASSSIDNMCVKSVLNPIPRTHNRPMCVTVNPVLVSRPTAFRRRFNLRKAKLEWIRNIR